MALGKEGQVLNGKVDMRATSNDHYIRTASITPRKTVLPKNLTSSPGKILLIF